MRFLHLCALVIDSYVSETLLYHRLLVVNCSVSQEQQFSGLEVDDESDWRAQRLERAAIPIDQSAVLHHC